MTATGPSRLLRPPLMLMYDPWITDTAWCNGLSIALMAWPVSVDLSQHTRGHGGMKPTQDAKWRVYLGQPQSYPLSSPEWTPPSPLQPLRWPDLDKLSSIPELHVEWINGIKWINAHCDFQRTHKTSFPTDNKAVSFESTVSLKKFNVRLDLYSFRFPEHSHITLSGGQDHGLWNPNAKVLFLVLSLTSHRTSEKLLNSQTSVYSSIKMRMIMPMGTGLMQGITEIHTGKEHPRRCLMWMLASSCRNGITWLFYR